MTNTNNQSSRRMGGGQRWIMAEYYDDRYRKERNRDYRDHDVPERGYSRQERGMMDRAGDEVRSWFGDDEAARRRQVDEAEQRRREARGYGDRDDRGFRVAERGYGEERWERDRDVESRGRPEWRWSERERPYESYRRPFEEARTTSFVGPAYGGALPYASPSGFEERNRARGGGEERGRFRGRGPRGYSRSDDRIREDVCDRLTDDPWIDASDIEVRVQNGEVTLAGLVRERQDKRFAEDLVDDIPGVREVHNQLRVGSGHEAERGTMNTTPGATSVTGTLTGSRPDAKSTERR
jgi:osmotically-inducible protein OsmY